MGNTGSTHRGSSEFKGIAAGLSGLQEVQKRDSGLHGGSVQGQVWVKVVVFMGGLLVFLEV